MNVREVHEIARKIATEMTPDHMDILAKEIDRQSRVAAGVFADRMHMALKFVPIYPSQDADPDFEVKQ